MNQTPTPPSPPSPVPSLPDASRCPECGRPNRCGIAEGATSCWCFDEPPIGCRSAETDRTKTCVCIECARGGEISSPCIAVCELDPATKVCIACHRTLDEIVKWPRLTDDARKRVHRRIHGLETESGQG